MKEVKIYDIRLKNFCDCADETYCLDGKSWDIFAANGKGKSRLATAIALLLTCKGLDGKTDFEIKPYTTDGIAHHQEHEISGALDINGKLLELKQIYTEDWTSGRGGKEAKLKGHTTTYFINDVKCSTKTEYLMALNTNIASEETLKLITNPTYFISSLPWEKRRAKLIEMVGDIPDSIIIESDSQFKDLPSILGQRSPQDHKKMAKDRIGKIDREKDSIKAKIEENQGKIDREKDSIKAKIEENQGKMPDILGIDQQKETERLARVNQTIEIDQKRLTQVELGGGIAEKKTQLQEVKSSMFGIELEHQKTLQNRINKLREEEDEIKHDINNVQTSNNLLNDSISLKQKIIERNDIERKKLRGPLWHEKTSELLKWEKLNMREWAIEKYNIKDNCPTCNKPYEQNEKEKIIKRAIEAQNLIRSKAIADINRELDIINEFGKKLRLESVEAEKIIAEHKIKIEEHEARITESKYRIEEIEALINHLQESKSDLSDNAEYQKFSKQVITIQQEIDDPKGGQTQNKITDEIKAKIESLKTERDSVKATLDKFTKMAELQDRIKELRDQEKQLNKEQEQLTREKDLCIEFIRTKIRMLESKINSMFKHTRWQMFKEHLNGNDPEEVCIPMGHNDHGIWVPYTVLSSGQRLSVGYDVVNTLMKHYDINAPIIGDNAEQFTLDFEKLGQVIQFKALKGQETLKFMEVS